MNIPNLDWNSLVGYYRMDDIKCGNLLPFTNVGYEGKLRNITTPQKRTAPLPYTSRIDNQNWFTDNTWTHYDVWDAPNNIGIDGKTRIDWNIVETSHDINSAGKDIKVLGLLSLVPNKTLNMAGTNPTKWQAGAGGTGNELNITHYLLLDGIIDLNGESQLVQPNGSIVDKNSKGELHRDQQGTALSFNYNYWSSPVSTGAENAEFIVSGY